MSITFTKTPVVIRNEMFGVDEHLLEVHPAINGAATDAMYFAPTDTDEKIQELVEDSLRRRGLIA